MASDMTDPAVVLARTIWREARGDGEVGMEAVASVILNRAAHPRWWGTDIISVCLKPAQFSCWDNGTALMANENAADPSFVLASTIAVDAVRGRLQDSTHGADSYYAVYIDPPYWTQDAQFTCQIGNQRFYRVELKQPE